MNKVIISLVLVVICTTSYSFSKPKSAPESRFPINSREVYVPVGGTGHLISLMDLSRISVKDFEKLSGKKMTFADKVKFKVGQRELRKKINEDGTFNSKQIENYLNASQKKGILMNISWAGLALGLFLNIIGVLIAYLITSKEGDHSMIKWAWIGAIISAIIWGAVLI